MFNQAWHQWLFFGCLGVLALTFLHLSFGAVSIPFSQLCLWLIGQADPQNEFILNVLRLPRALLAASVGACLAICGCATQSLFRNPLADPSLIGVSAGASAGASLVIVFFSGVHFGFAGLSLVSLGAFLGAIAVVICVYRISTGITGTSVVTMLLAGVAFSYLAGSFASVLEYIANNDMLRRISLWRMGGLDGADIPRAILMLTITSGALVLLLKMAPALNALLLGESEARHLGFSVAHIKLKIFICVALGVGCSVALAGVIAFVGLVVPHMVRLLVGPNHARLIPLSACAGAMLLLIADTLARVLIAPAELPVGLLITFIGAPLFISLLRGSQKNVV